MSMNLGECIKCRPSGLNFFPGRCTLSPRSPSTLLYSHSWSLWVIYGISQKFSHFAEPMEPQASTKWAGGLPKPGLVGRFPVLPVSSWAGKRQNSFFHSISFSFWCWLYPKRWRDNERDRRRKSTESFTVEERICGSSSLDPVWGVRVSDDIYPPCSHVEIKRHFS